MIIRLSRRRRTFRTLKILRQLFLADPQLFADFGGGKLSAFDQVIYCGFLIFSLSATSCAVYTLFIDTYHNIGCLNNCVSIRAYFQAKFFHRRTGDGSSDDISTTDIDGNDGIYSSWLMLMIFLLTDYAH